ncbi:MAG: hypothetical protein ACKVOA_01960 [Methylophilaceae bacterium]
MKDRVFAESEFIAHADDSSDEEETGAFYIQDQKLSKRESGFVLKDIFSSRKYQILLMPEQIESFALRFQKDTDNYYGGAQDNNWFWYFIIYDLGLRLLYHPKVEENYQKKKKACLAKSFLEYPYQNKPRVDEDFSTVSKRHQVNVPDNRAISLMLIKREGWLSASYDANLAQDIRRICLNNRVTLQRNNLLGRVPKPICIAITHKNAAYGLTTPS